MDEKKKYLKITVQWYKTGKVSFFEKVGVGNKYRFRTIGSIGILAVRNLYSWSHIRVKIIVVTEGGREQSFKGNNSLTWNSSLTQITINK